jgi:hypothetical protein
MMTRIRNGLKRPLLLLTLPLALAGCDAPTGLVIPTEEIRRLEITPERPVLTAIGDSMQLAALATDAGGNTISECEAAWRSTDANTVKVNARGKIVGKAAGVALIIATCGSQADSTEVEVKTSIAAVSIDPATLSLDAGQTRRISALAADSAGNEVEGVRFTWSSTDPSVAAVDSTGLVSAVAGGTTKITASLGSLEATSAVTVASKQAPPPPTGSVGDFVTYPNERVAFIAGPQVRAKSAASPWPWFDDNAAERGLHWAAQSEVDYYYDHALVQYINYYRTGDTRFLEVARREADRWYEARQPHGTSTAPRSMALGGIMLRAIELEEVGDPRADEMWDFAAHWARHHDRSWLNRHYERHNLWSGVRDGAYVLLYMTQLAKVHPDADVRADMLDRAEKGAILYYARLQHADGSWRWGGESNSNNNESTDFEQPFMIGLLLDALSQLHQLNGDPVVRETILRGVDHLWRDAYDRQELPTFNQHSGIRMRGFYYKVFGDNCTPPIAVDAPCGNLFEGNPGKIRDVRHRSGTIVAAFGYAYKLTGDTKYITQGDDIFSAAFGGDGGGAGADGFTGLASFRAKEYNFSYRSSGRYLAWRAGF